VGCRFELVGCRGVFSGWLKGFVRMLQASVKNNPMETSAEILIVRFMANILPRL
jgi:hypothetical protein